MSFKTLSQPYPLTRLEIKSLSPEQKGELFNALILRQNMSHYISIFMNEVEQGQPSIKVFLTRFLDGFENQERFTFIEMLALLYPVPQNPQNKIEIPGMPSTFDLEDSKLRYVVYSLVALDTEERKSVMRFFCHSCRSIQDPNKPCQCWNDE